MKYAIGALIAAFLFVFLAALSAGHPVDEAAGWGLLMVVMIPFFIGALAGAVTLVSGFKWTEKERRKKYDL